MTSVPVQGEEYQFYLALVDSSDPTQFVTDPTIEAGDFQISTDGGTLVNLATLPSSSPSGSTLVVVSLSASEMTGSKVNVQGIDQSGDEWQDVNISIDVPEGSEESNYNILVGDHIETSTSMVINKRGTSTPVLEKTVGGSLLDSSATITTTDA